MSTTTTDGALTGSDFAARKLLTRLAEDLRRNHMDDADHLEHVMASEPVLIDALLDPTSKLWGAIPLEILEKSSEGKAYLELIEQFITLEQKLRAVPEPVATAPLPDDGYLAEVANMEMFADLDIMELLSDTKKLEELSADVQNAVSEGKLDMGKIESEIQKILQTDNGEFADVLGSLLSTSGASDDVNEMFAGMFNALGTGGAGASGGSNCTIKHGDSITDTIDALD